MYICLPLFHILFNSQACGVGYSMETVNCCEYSFAASAGWDAVTGLGSPNFDIISNLVINNATAFPNVGAYPSGTASMTTVYTSNDDDNEDHKTQREVALGLASAGVALALIALAFTAYVYSLKSRSGADSSSNISPMH